LRSILEGILMDPMFDIPTATDIEEVIINEDVVTGTAQPLVVHTNKGKEAKPSAKSS
jgi:ATP-dependent Clp protease ATP-binding subunit ClpX